VFETRRHEPFKCVVPKGADDNTLASHATKSLNLELSVQTLRLVGIPLFDGCVTSSEGFAYPVGIIVAPRLKCQGDCPQHEAREKRSFCYLPCNFVRFVVRHRSLHASIFERTLSIWMNKQTKYG
jgi:hypothetical protein